MLPKFIHIHKQQAEEWRFSSNARPNKYVNVDYIQEWIDNNRLNDNPPSYDRQTIAQNEVYIQLEALINEVEIQ